MLTVSDVIKYFGFELGAQTNTNPADDRWIINGAHEASKLQDYLDGFIQKFVLCKKCKNPETDVNIKDGHIVLDCKACGQRSDVDLRLKLSGFILKNQPKKGKKDKSTKKAERKAKKEGQNGHGDDDDHSGSPHDSNSDKAEENGDEEIDAGSDDELTRRINSGAKDIDVADAGEVKWSVDTSEEAVRARAKELPSDLKRALVVEDDNEDGEGGEGNAYDALGSWVINDAKAKGGVSKLEDVDIYLKAKELGIETKHRTLQVLAQTIFDDNIVKQIPNRAGMLKKMITSEKHERALLGGTERFVGKEHPDLIPQVSAILMQFYQHDLLTEETAKAWGSKASKKYVDISISKKVRKSAGSFLEWLDQASEEESSDEE